MAKIGFEYVAAAKLDDKTSTSKADAKYSEGREIGPAAAFNGTPTTSDVKDFGDDRTLETDTSVTGGTLSMELNEPTMENEAWILGHKFETETKGMIRNVNDIAPYLGVGCVGKSKRDGKIIYKSKIYLKTQFRVPNDENTTKQEQVTFNHTAMEGNIFQLKNGDWKDEKEFATLDEAKGYINTTLNITQEESGGE